MKIEIVLPYPGLPTAKVTIPDAQDEMPKDVTGDDTGEQNTGDDTMDTGEDTGDTGDDQFQ